MGTDATLNILALRFANVTFEPIWNNRYVDHIQVLSADPLSVGHRGFYDEAGQLRDVFQNHLMQYLALALMEPPDRLEATAIADSKIALLLPALSVASPPVNSVVRGQYVAGVIDGFEVPGYRVERH